MPGGAGREDYSAMPTGGSGATYDRGPNQGGHHPPARPAVTPKKKTTTGDGVKKFVSNMPSVKLANWAYKGVKSIFQPKTEQQKVQANIDRGYDVLNPAEMHRATQRKPVPVGGGPGDRDGLQNTIATRSLVTAPTADKAGGFGHQWGFQAYPGTPGTTYDPTKYAKQGKMISKYGTGQEVKNFSKGKRFGPPPEKGPDPQGLHAILENSDYFKTLIG